MARGSAIKVWTPERVALLRALWDDLSLSCSDIAKRMGVTKSSVIGAAHHRKFPQRPHAGGWIDSAHAAWRAEARLEPLPDHLQTIIDRREQRERIPPKERAR